MLNRRLIRIKVFKVLYSMVTSGSDSLIEAEKALNYSCEKTLHLYYFMLNAAVALKNAAQARIDTGLKKFNPTPEERNPNRKFASNQVAACLEGDPRFVKFCEDHGLVWTEDLATFIRKTLAALSERDYFKEYMASETSSMAEDCDLYVKIFSDLELFEDNEDLASTLEDMSLFWIDDLGFVLSAIVRNIEVLRTRGTMPVPGVFLKDDDREFAVGLLPGGDHRPGADSPGYRRGRALLQHTAESNHQRVCRDIQVLQYGQQQGLRQRTPGPYPPQDGGHRRDCQDRQGTYRKLKKLIIFVVLLKT